MARNNEDLLPIRESMRKQSHRYGWDADVFNHGWRNYKTVGRYIDKCLRKSIGQNYDKVKKHILDKMKYANKAWHTSSVIETILERRFCDDWSEFIIDSQNRIQLNKKYLQNRKKWAEYKKKQRTTVVLDDKKFYRLKPNLTQSQIHLLEASLLSSNIPLGEWFTNLCCGGIISESIYNDKLGIHSWWRKKLENHEFVLSCFELAQDIETKVYKDKSKDYRKWKKETSDAKAKEQREIQRDKQHILETLIHDIESEKKLKEEARNIIDRDRLGFNDDSFKGEFYHGQKRKKYGRN